jgi:capsular polysaccharide biosynthesis protein
MEEEIEIRQFWQILRKRWILVLVLPVIAALISGLISFYVLKPVYQASTTLIVGEKASESPQSAGEMLDYDVLLANEKLAKTYGAIAQSRTVVQKVIDDLNLRVKVEELNKLISVKPVADTELLEIQVNNTSPELAALIANTMVQEFSKAVIDIKNVDSVSIVDKAVIPEKPILPRKILNVLVAFAAGLMTAIGLVFLLESMDNSVKSSEDVEKLLGIPVLSVIPKG